MTQAFPHMIQFGGIKPTMLFPSGFGVKTKRVDVVGAKYHVAGRKELSVVKPLSQLELPANRGLYF